MAIYVTRATFSWQGQWIRNVVDGQHPCHQSISSKLVFAACFFEGRSKNQKQNLDGKSSYAVNVLFALRFLNLRFDFGWAKKLETAFLLVSKVNQCDEKTPSKLPLHVEQSKLDHILPIIITTSLIRTKERTPETKKDRKTRKTRNEGKEAS